MCVEAYEHSCFENFVLKAASGSELAAWIRELGALNPKTSLVYEKDDSWVHLYAYITTIVAKQNEVFGSLYELQLILIGLKRGFHSRCRSKRRRRGSGRSFCGSTGGSSRP